MEDSCAETMSNGKEEGKRGGLDVYWTRRTHRANRLSQKIDLFLVAKGMYETG